MTVLDVMREAGMAFDGVWQGFATFLKGVIVYIVLPSMLLVTLWAARDARLRIWAKLEQKRADRFPVRLYHRLLIEPVLDAFLVAGLLVLFAVGVVGLVASLRPDTTANDVSNVMGLLAYDFWNQFKGMMSLPFQPDGWPQVWHFCKVYLSEMNTAKPQDMAGLLTEWAACWAVAGYVIRFYWAPVAFTLDLLRAVRTAPVAQPAH